MSEGRLNAIERRHKALFDPMYLADLLGYDFSKCPHALELIRSVGPPIIEAGICTPVLFSELDKRKSRMVLWSRGHFKTSAVELYIVNLILAYPDIRIAIMQSTLKNSKLLLASVKSHFDGSNPRSRLDKDFPDWCKDTRLGQADAFISPARKRVQRDPTVAVASPKSTKAGLHFDFMFADDLVTEINYRNQELQEKLIQDFNHYTSLLAGTDGYKTVTGTRYSFGDLYGWIIRNDAERREWAISVKDCWKEGKKENGPLFPRVEVEPSRFVGFTTEQLEAMEKDDPETFSCQYLNKPIAAGQQRFPESLLMTAVHTQADKNAPSLGPTVLILDLAASQRSGADHSVVLAGQQDSLGKAYVVDMRAGRYGPMQMAQQTLEMALKHRPAGIFIEGTAAGKYFIEYLRIMAKDIGLNIPVQSITVSNTKDAKFLRISALEGYLRTGRLKFFAGLPGWSVMVEQFTQFPKSRHDDEIDTVSLLMQYYQTAGTSYLIRKMPSIADEIIRRAKETLDPIQFITHIPENSALECCGGDYCD